MSASLRNKPLYADIIYANNSKRNKFHQCVRGIPRLGPKLLQKINLMEQRAQPFEIRNPHSLKSSISTREF